MAVVQSSSVSRSKTTKNDKSCMEGGGADHDLVTADANL